ncbi:MAG: hypothetical protein DBO99_13190 [gamma proteobacterium symbiont of Ctena orbiculata]|nr:MAG: hypothetical protein DBO99_13190 [gamma proteobacterium symbiont of Ctena orbiculata]
MLQIVTYRTMIFCFSIMISGTYITLWCNANPISWSSPYLIFYVVYIFSIKIRNLINRFCFRRTIRGF